jgi:hypothetical protein
MAINNRRELSLLNHEEAELINSSHHPALGQLDAKSLAAAKRRLRDLRSKERSLSRQKTREVRGKAEPRGGSFPGTAERPRERKQIFAAALKRVNNQETKLEVEAAKAAHIEASRRALAMRLATPGPAVPKPGRTASKGLRPVENKKVSSKTAPAKVGSVSQATKNAQAKRDHA